MADRPILFSGPMIRAILAGRKTQTRRNIKQPFQSGYFQGEIFVDVIKANSTAPKAFRFSADAVGGGAVLNEVFEPRINEGDRLWVRESWKATGLAAFNKPSETRICGRFAYQADAEQLPRDQMIPWRPSIHMPRWASRLTLTVTDVRVERLQDITLRDAFAEGCAIRQIDLFGAEGEQRNEIGRAYYRSVWEDINGPGSWRSNPWVIAYTFTPVFQNIDRIAA